MLHLSIQLQAKKNPYLNNLPPLVFYFLFISQISEEGADLNEGSWGRGPSMANLQLFQLAPFQHLQLEGDGIRLQLVLRNSHRVESGGLCQNKTDRKHPDFYFVKSHYPTFLGRDCVSNTYTQMFVWYMFVWPLLTQTTHKKNNFDTDTWQAKPPASQHKGGRARTGWEQILCTVYPLLPPKILLSEWWHCLSGRLVGRLDWSFSPAYWDKCWQMCSPTGVHLALLYKGWLTPDCCLEPNFSSLFWHLNSSDRHWSHTLKPTWKPDKQKTSHESMFASVLLLCHPFSSSSFLFS